MHAHTGLFLPFLWPRLHGYITAESRSTLKNNKHKNNPGADWVDAACRVCRQLFKNKKATPVTEDDFLCVWETLLCFEYQSSQIYSNNNIQMNL